MRVPLGVKHHLILHESQGYVPVLKADLDDIAGLPHIGVDELLVALLHPFDLVDPCKRIAELVSDGQGLQDV